MNSKIEFNSIFEFKEGVKSIAQMTGKEPLEVEGKLWNLVQQWMEDAERYCLFCPYRRHCESEGYEDTGWWIWEIIFYHKENGFYIYPRLRCLKEFPPTSWEFSSYSCRSLDENFNRSSKNE